MERRTALKLMAAGVAAERLQIAGQQLVALAEAPASYKLQFFSKAQDKTLDRLTEMIIPADDHSPGAHAAKVSQFIDLMVANSEKPVRDQWAADLKALDEDAKKRFQKSFSASGASQQDEMMAAMAAGEPHPSTKLEHFFVRLKRMTINGYYTSKIGIHQELQYKGNTAQAEFIGCTHPEHQA